MSHQARLICVHLEGSIGKFRLIGLTPGSSIKCESIRLLLDFAPGDSRLSFVKRMCQRYLPFGVERS
jgi:hypothetical protein